MNTLCKLIGKVLRKHHPKEKWRYHHNYSGEVTGIDLVDGYPIYIHGDEITFFGTSDSMVDRFVLNLSDPSFDLIKFINQIISIIKLQRKISERILKMKEMSVSHQLSC